MLYEIATPDVGLASAGYAARAQDPSTLFTNPAGMSRLDGSQFQAGAQLLYGNVEFSPDSGTGPLLGTESGGIAVGALQAGSLFFTQTLSERFTVGVGVLSYFGLAQEYDENWVGRYYLQEGDLLGLSLMPAVSFKATDWLSIGAGLNAMYGFMDTQVAVRTLPSIPPPPSTDGRLNLSDEAWGFGANLGLLFTLLANGGWQNWNQFGYVEVGVDSATPISLTKELNYQDTWHAAVGGQYRVSESWLLSAGFAYDSSAVSDANRTVALPMSETYRLGVGAQWQVSRAISLGVAYEFAWIGDMPVSQASLYRGRLSGTYDDARLSFFTANLTWRF